MPGRLEDLRTTYYRDCAPIVHAAPGNLDVYLLEPAEGSGQIVACTIWRTEQDAIAYDTSGTALEVVGKVKHYFAGPPALRSYRVRRPPLS